MRFPHISAALLVTSLVACGTATPLAPKASEAPQGELMGSDRDAHGCISSAGYSWCARTNQCERPWELARKQGFAQTQEAFYEYCANPSQ